MCLLNCLKMFVKLCLWVVNSTWDLTTTNLHVLYTCISWAHRWVIYIWWAPTLCIVWIVARLVWFIALRWWISLSFFSYSMLKSDTLRFNALYVLDPKSPIIHPLPSWFMYFSDFDCTFESNGDSLSSLFAGLSWSWQAITNPSELGPRQSPRGISSPHFRRLYFLPSKGTKKPQPSPPPEVGPEFDRACFVTAYATELYVTR